MALAAHSHIQDKQLELRAAPRAPAVLRRRVGGGARGFRGAGASESGEYSRWMCGTCRPALLCHDPAGHRALPATGPCGAGQRGRLTT